MLKQISYRVMKMAEFDGKNPSVYYKVDCSCGDSRDILTFEIELDSEFNGMTLTTYCNTMWSSYWGLPNIFQRIWYRISGAFKILLFGELKFEHSIILQGEEHIQSFIDALEEGKCYIKKEKEKEKESTIKI